MGRPLAMMLDKPVVLSEDVQELAALFVSEPVTTSRRLGGVPNVTFKIATAEDTIALRVCNNGYTSPEHLLAEVAVLDHLRDVSFGLSPKVRRGRDGLAIQYWRNYRVIAMDFIEGVGADCGVVSLEICQQVGREVARLRRALESYRGSLPEAESFEHRTRRLLEALPQTATELGWDIPIALVISGFEASLRVFRDNASWPPKAIVHTDVWPPNVLIDHDGVIGIVDFDDMATAPPILDLSAVITEFALTPAGEIKRAEASAVLTGYRSIAGPISPLEFRCLVAGIKASCSGWLSCNALHRVPFEDSQAYLLKLQRLSSPREEERLERALASL